MRISIAAAKGVGRVLGLVGDAERVNARIFDREANGEAFAGERLVRLPRRVTRGLKLQGLAARMNMREALRRVGLEMRGNDAR